MVACYWVIPCPPSHCPTSSSHQNAPAPPLPLGPLLVPPPAAPAAAGGPAEDGVYAHTVAATAARGAPLHPPAPATFVAKRYLAGAGAASLARGSLVGVDELACVCVCVCVERGKGKFTHRDRWTERGEGVGALHCGHCLLLTWKTKSLSATVMMSPSCRLTCPLTSTVFTTVKFVVDTFSNTNCAGEDDATVGVSGATTRTLQCTRDTVFTLMRISHSDPLPMRIERFILK